MRERDWQDFKEINGGYEGARAKFENACELLFKKLHPGKKVQTVRVKQGDGGIDVFIGELGVEPITVIQCKFFLDVFEEPQKQQVRDSFSTASDHSDYELKNWILCIPRTLDIDQHKWWSGWKDKKTKKLGKPGDFISLFDGNELIIKMKEKGIYDEIFQMHEAQMLEEIHRAVVLSSDLPETKDNSEKSYEKSLLKIAYAMSKADSMLRMTKKQIFDAVLLGIIGNETKWNADISIPQTDLFGVVRTHLKSDMPDAQIEAAVGRLVSKGKVKLRGGALSIDSSVVVNGGNQDSDFEIIREWVVGKMTALLGAELSAKDQAQVCHNAINSIVGFYKLYAYEILIEDGLSSDVNAKNVILSYSTQSLSDEISEALILVLGRLLNTPDEALKPVLDRIRKTYLGLQMLGMDPKLRSVHSMSFSNKKYVLDTDFVLNLIADNARKTLPYRRIVKVLLDGRAQVIIPVEVLSEVADHAKYAHRSYTYFVNCDDHLDDDLTLEQIQNVFVESYVRKHGFNGSVSFSSYIRNYYDEEDEVGFLQELIEEEVSPAIEFVSLVDDFSLSAENLVFLDKIQEEILKMTLLTPKSGYRDDDENKLIAKIDALMYVNFYQENSADKDRYGVVTHGTRALGAARDFGVYERFYIKPPVILAYIESVSPYDLDFRDIVAVIDNPFLHHSINSNWDEIKAIINVGGDLRGRNVTRLKRDLKGVATEALYADGPDTITKDKLEVVQHLNKRGYRFDDDVEKLITDIQETKAENVLLHKQVEEFEEKEKARAKYNDKQRKKQAGQSGKKKRRGF